jgi:hypothetical protein
MKAMQSLFIEPDLTFEKVAAETSLPEDPNSWPQEVLQELYKQVPYIADFDPHVQMVKVDAERGYGFGQIDVENQSEAQFGTPPDQQAAAGIRKVRLPVIIKDGKLQPFDLLVTDDSKVCPLTETRLRTALFRPQAFDVTSKTPGDVSMISQLYPPFRQGYGYGGGGVAMDVGMGKASSATDGFVDWVLEEEGDEKTASGDMAEYFSKNPQKYEEWKERHKKMEKQGSILKAITPTINLSDWDRFTHTLESDLNLQAAFTKNAAASHESLQTILGFIPGNEQKVASVFPDILKPNVAQLVRTDDGYKVKTANCVFWNPTSEVVDRGEAVHRFGEKVVLAADLSGAATVSDTEGAVAEDEDTGEAAPVTESGLYKVQDTEGKELIGMVFTDLLDVDGGPVPLSLFTNGSQSAVQSDIAGVPAGESVEVPTEDSPSGFGAFVSAKGEELQATVPLELSGSFEGAGEDELRAWQGQTFDGRGVQVSVQPNIQTVVGSGDGTMLVPEHWRWMPLEASGQTALKGDAADVGKEAEYRRKIASVEVRAAGTDCFSVRGPAIDKLAYGQKEMLSLDDTMFLLAGLGVNQEYGVAKLAEAISGGSHVDIRISRVLRTDAEMVKEAMDEATAKLASLPSFRRQLFKEAAVIPDPIAVDTVLSLGFINPENVMTFIGYLPVIEDAQKKMCELLFASRVGLQDIPVSALERAVRTTEEVLEGLKILAFQGN